MRLEAVRSALLFLARFFAFFFPLAFLFAGVDVWNRRHEKVHTPTLLRQVQSEHAAIPP